MPFIDPFEIAMQVGMVVLRGNANAEDVAENIGDPLRPAFRRLLGQCPLDDDEPAEQMLAGLSGDLFIPRAAYCATTSFVALTD